METIKAEKTKRFNTKTMIATIDVGKQSNTGYFRCPDGTECKPFLFNNTRNGFEHFWHTITQARDCYGLSDIVVGFESTGPYSEPIAHYLAQREVTIVQVNTFHVKRVKELSDNSPNKNDYKDPKIIADLLELGRYYKTVVPQGISAELRRLTQGRERRVAMRTQLFNQLESLIAVVFPEFLQIVLSIDSKTAAYLLKKYPTPQKLSTVSIQSLCARLFKISRGRFSYEKTMALVQAARDSIGINTAQESLIYEIHCILNQIAMINQLIKTTEQKMTEYLKKIPVSRYMLSMKGLGIITIAGILGEVGDFNRYHSIKELMKLAGLDLYELSSGKHRGKRRISKRGRPLLRKLLYFAALNVVRKNGILHHKYQEFLLRGMPRIKALIAIARKLFTILFALVRKQTLFIEHYQSQSTRVPICV